LFYLLSISILLSIIPLFTPLNISNSYLVKELNVSDLVNRGTSTAQGTRKPVRLVVYKREYQAKESKKVKERTRLYT
jgi:inner membrane protein involved in colicin E2 resistance